MGLDVNIFVFLIYGVAAVTIYHSYKFRGAFKTLMFLLGVLVVTSGIENIQVAIGGYSYPTPGITILIWKCPLWVVLGWYEIIYCSNFVSHYLIGKGKGSLQTVGIGTEQENGIDKEFIKLTLIRAVFTAYAAVLVDLIMDPVGVANGWWAWLIDNIYIHDIPFGNYFGWVLVIFWTTLFYEIIITWANTKKKKAIIPATVWAAVSFVAMLLAGVILMGFCFWTGLEGIKTEDLSIDRTYVLDLIIAFDWTEILIIGFSILITMGLVLLTSLAPDKKPEPRPTNKVWYQLPSALMIFFWAAMLAIGFFTDSLYVAVGILNCIPLLWIHFHVIKTEGAM